MRVPLTKYGLRELCLFGVALVAAAAATWLLYPPLLPVPLIALAFVVCFFRDPLRVPPANAAVLVAPADGKVVEIEEVAEEEFLEGEALKIGIFLSVFNVHINRAPCAGRVENIAYRPGKFRNALLGCSSQQNESNTIQIVGVEGGLRVLVRQIAGAIARRIVCDCRVDDALDRGQKIGMIKFGSRTELYIPKAVAFKLHVKKGDKVKAGETSLGELQ